MSVLVKGMKMPSSCGFCVMLDEDDKNFCYAEMRGTTIGADRPEWCPLVEVNLCDTCYIAQNYNLEDDDSPCQNCGVEE